MAAGEDHAEQVVISAVGVDPVAVVAVLAGHGGREQGQLLLPGPGPAQPVDGLAAGGGGQPAAAVGREFAVPPVLDGLDERILDGVFGQAYVAEPRGERGPDPGRLLLVDPLERSRVHAVSLS
jgi:hypothetical protein